MSAHSVPLGLPFEPVFSDPRHVKDARLALIDALADFFDDRFPGLVGARHRIERDFSQINGSDQLL